MQPPSQLNSPRFPCLTAVRSKQEMPSPRPGALGSVAEPWRAQAGRPNPDKAADGSLALSAGTLGHGFFLFIHRERGPFKEPGLQTSAQAQVPLATGAWVSPLPFCQLPRPGSSHMKDCKEPAPYRNCSQTLFFRCFPASEGENLSPESAWCPHPLALQDTGDSSVHLGC